MKFRSFTLFCGVFCLISCALRAEEMPALRHGLNLSGWLANAFRQPLYARDFAQIKSAGFDHVRLPFNPTYYGFRLTSEVGTEAQLDFITLDRAIASAEQYNLPLILDLHPDSDFMDTLEHQSWAEQDFVILWKTIAEHYKNHGSQDLIFELLNEPQYYHAESKWTQLASRAVAAIHKISPGRLIVIGAPHGSEIDALPFVQTTADPKLLYAFHFYEPYIITHQGIHQGFSEKMIRFFRNLPYPSALATKSASEYAPLAPNPGEAQKELLEYMQVPWDRDHIAKRMANAHDWAIQHHVRLLCGEFGVLRNHIDPDSRYRWIKDARLAMDNDDIGWEIWDYADLFGITTPVGPTSTDPVDGSVRLANPLQGSRKFDPPALEALGLKAGIQ